MLAGASLLLLAFAAGGCGKIDRVLVPLAQVKSGSGFFVTPGGDLVTSAHVITGCPAISVWAEDGAQRAGSSVIADNTLDIALVRAPGAPTDYARAPGLDGPPPGAAVFTLGYGVLPRDPRRPVSADGTLGGADAIGSGVPVRVVNARLQHGHSGGPVIDSRGGLVGMVIGRYAESADHGVILPTAEIESFLTRHGVHLAAGRSPGEARPQRFLKAIAALVQCTPPPTARRALPRGHAAF